MSVANQRSTPAGAKVNNEVKNLNAYTWVFADPSPLLGMTGARFVRSCSQKFRLAVKIQRLSAPYDERAARNQSTACDGLSISSTASGPA